MPASQLLSVQLNRISCAIKIATPNNSIGWSILNEMKDVSIEVPIDRWICFLSHLSSYISCGSWLHLFIHWMHTCILYLIPLHKIFEHHSNWLAEREWYVCECVRVRFVPLASSGVSRYISSVWKPIRSYWYWFLLGWLVSADAFLSQIHHHERQFVENSIKYWRWHKKGDSMKQNYNESRARAKKKYTHIIVSKRKKDGETWKFGGCDA